MGDDEESTPKEVRDATDKLQEVADIVEEVIESVKDAIDVAIQQLDEFSDVVFKGHKENQHHDDH